MPLQAGPGSGSELGTPASGVLHAAERDGLAAPSVDWQLGALAEEVRRITSSHWTPPSPSMEVRDLRTLAGSACRRRLTKQQVNKPWSCSARQAVGQAPGVGAAAMLPSPPRVAQAREAASTPADAAFWGTIGHLYAAARAELIR